ncbi:MAG: DCC1-like thiol-disulfide oxidoreductase family protein, partial [Pseudomonadota bacterium]
MKALSSVGLNPHFSIQIQSFSVGCCRVTHRKTVLRYHVQLMDVSQRPWSWRADPEVPDFDDQTPVLFVDGNCALCSVWARLVCRYDRTGALKICPVQTPLGRSMLRHFGLDPDDPESWLFIDRG